MLAFAQIFVDGTAAEGRTFDWQAGSAQWLDGLCEAFLAGDPAGSPASCHGAPRPG
jgi:hypothetical protein